ncbi:hypothetical protein ACNTMW_02750 [Planosporangium sp. 12N6]|uniref:hypothetical protein n=1 Tax=Planosporangium spinosum TaxID=3402278 RepID=UPI003CE9B5D8
MAAAIALASIGGAVWAATATPADRPGNTAATSQVLADRAQVADARADRSQSRETATPGAKPRESAPQSTPPKPRPQQNTAAPPAPSTQPPMPTAPAPAPAPAPSPTRPAPVADLDQAQMDNAVSIVAAGRQMNLPRRAFVVAISTALQESNLRVLANPNVPGSMNRPNQGVGYDHDSVGLFQQRPNWGTVDQLMNPQESARRFYEALVKIPGWEQLAVTVAAQRVQVSAFPDAYAKHQTRAEQIVDAIV